MIDNHHFLELFPQVLFGSINTVIHDQMQHQVQLGNSIQGKSRVIAFPFLGVFP